MEKNKCVLILGTVYKISYNTREKDTTLNDKDGYTDDYQKRIVVASEKSFNENWDRQSIEIYQKKVLRHEIIHAFLYESGLDVNSNKAYSWAENEEMVDWFAIQSPKIYKIYKDLDIL